MEQTPKDKAKLLIEKYRPFMYCYVGSEMLTNTFNEQEQIRNAKECVKFLVNEIIEVEGKNWLSGRREQIVSYWQNVLTEVDAY